MEILGLSLLFLLTCLDACWSFRILGYFPFPGSSHHQAFVPILHELARRGHQVVYLTSVDPKVSHPNLEVRMIKNFKQEYMDYIDLQGLGRRSALGVSNTLSSLGVVFADEYYGDPEAQKLIHGTEKFDAVLMESYFNQEPVSALIHKFGCVGIEVSSLGDSAWINEMSGLPDNPAYQIDFKTTFTDELSPLESVHNFYVTWSTVLVSYYYLWRMQSVMDQYFNYTGWESRPSIFKLASNRSMVLINRHVALDYPYPKAPHVKDIGGVNILPNKPLPEEIKRYMDDAASGVIYFSLGSNLNTSEIMNSQFGEAFFSVFPKLPQKVLLKWESDRNYTLPPNVKTSKWLPQQDVLAHNNCVLFITHGGLMSLMESVYHGVPVLGIPFFGDQPKNFMQVESAGYGLQLAFDNVTKDSVSWALEEILKNPRYKLEAGRRSRMMREEGRPAVERAAHWVEYAIKYPNALTPRAAYLSFIQLHLIHVFLFFVVAIVLLYISIRTVLSMFVRRNNLPFNKLKTS